MQTPIAFRLLGVIFCAGQGTFLFSLSGCCSSATFAQGVLAIINVQ